MNNNEIELQELESNRPRKPSLEGRPNFYPPSYPFRFPNYIYDPYVRTDAPNVSQNVPPIQETQFNGNEPQLQPRPQQQMQPQVRRTWGPHEGSYTPWVNPNYSRSEVQEWVNDIAMTTPNDKQLMSQLASGRRLSWPDSPQSLLGAQGFSQSSSWSPPLSPRGEGAFYPGPSSTNAAGFRMGAKNPRMDAPAATYAQAGATNHNYRGVGGGMNLKY